MTLVTDPISKITGTGVATADGDDHPVDVLILATGFKVMESGNVLTYSVRRVDGRDLEPWWDDNRLQAYEGVSVPGFPNFFSIIGALRLQRLVLLHPHRDQTRHIVRCLHHARTRAAPTASRSARRPTTATSAEMIARGAARCSGRRKLANSYYFDKNGDVPLRPTTVEATGAAAGTR